MKDIDEIKKEADLLKESISQSINDFRIKTGISPEINITLAEFKTNCGSFFDFVVVVKMNLS